MPWFFTLRVFVACAYIGDQTHNNVSNGYRLCRFADLLVNVCDIGSAGEADKEPNSLSHKGAVRVGSEAWRALTGLSVIDDSLPTLPYSPPFPTRITQNCPNDVAHPVLRKDRTLSALKAWSPQIFPVHRPLEVVQDTQRNGRARMPFCRSGTAHRTDADYITRRTCDAVRCARLICAVLKSKVRNAADTHAS